MSELIIGWTYRHFKGKEYKVIGVAKHSETFEEFVVYQKLYDDGGLWIRPKDMFLEVVEQEWKKFNRFEFVKNNEDR